MRARVPASRCLLPSGETKRGALESALESARRSAPVVPQRFSGRVQNRAYHLPRSHDEIMTILQAETGRKYDPELMLRFNDLIENSEFRVAPE